jgi:hypothetical protein
MRTEGLGLGRQRHMRLGLKRARQAGRGCNGNPFQHHGSVCTTRLEPEGSAPRQEGRERRAMVTCDWLGSNLASTATLDCQPNELHGDISNRVAHTTCAPDCWAAQRGELGEEVLAEGEAAHDRTAGERVQMVHACCSRTRRARSDPPTPGHNRPPRARCKCSPACGLGGQSILCSTFGGARVCKFVSPTLPCQSLGQVGQAYTRSTCAADKYQLAVASRKNRCQSLSFCGAVGGKERNQRVWGRATKQLSLVVRPIWGRVAGSRSVSKFSSVGLASFHAFREPVTVSTT